MLELSEKDENVVALHLHIKNPLCVGASNEMQIQYLPVPMF